MEQITKDLLQVEKIINSCKTIEQLLSCDNLIHNFYRSYALLAYSINDRFEVMEMYYYLEQKIKGKRKKLTKKKQLC